jgi:EAL and modified HD-GYP domain-containing signal transduction protein
LDAGVQNVFIGRQPILDRSRQTYAYELLFRGGAQNSAIVDDDLATTARVLDLVISEFGIETALGPYLGFVNLDARMLHSDAVELLPSEKFVLEVLETVEITAEVVARCRQLKDLGYRLALDDFVTLEAQHRPLLELVDFVKVDLKGLDSAMLPGMVQALRRWPVRLLAEKVDEEALFRQCHDLGFDYFQGYHFARPVIIAGRKFSHWEQTLNRLLGLVLEDADASVLEVIFKQEPGLTVNLLRLTNSAAAGLRQQITSVRNAINVLGRRQLQRWLQLLLFADNSPGAFIPSPLLQLAAMRGRFMELLARDLSGGDGDLEDRAFMTGIMSLMPVLLHLPVGEIVATLNVAEDVRAALEKGSGLLGRMLQICEALERGEIAACSRLLPGPPAISRSRVNTAQVQALAWANDIGRKPS